MRCEGPVKSRMETRETCVLFTAHQRRVLKMVTSQNRRSQHLYFGWFPHPEIVIRRENGDSMRVLFYFPLHIYVHYVQTWQTRQGSSKTPVVFGSQPLFPTLGPLSRRQGEIASLDLRGWCSGIGAVKGLEIEGLTQNP